MARRGKIARLPKEVREELNQRLQNGEAAAPLVEWLNGLPTVQEVLKTQFEGNPVSEQNLSEWRNGGYREWEAQQQATGILRDTRIWADLLNQSMGDVGISDCLATVVATEMTNLARTMLAEETDSMKRWKLLGQVNKQLSRMRRQDHQMVRVMIQRDRWKREIAKVEKPLNHPQLTPEQRQQRIKEIYGRA